MYICIYIYKYKCKVLELNDDSNSFGYFFKGHVSRIAFLA